MILKEITKKCRFKPKFDNDGTLSVDIVYKGEKIGHINHVGGISHSKDYHVYISNKNGYLKVGLFKITLFEKLNSSF